MALIRSRQALIGCRTQLVNHVRGAVKSFGARLPKCPASSFHNKAPGYIPEALWPALGPILETIGSLTGRIRDYERHLETISKEHYPETDLLRQVEGIGPLSAPTFVLTLEDPYRFEKNRNVGAYLGLVPAQDRSGDRDPQKRISKEGDEMLRRLLVGSAHYILGPFGSDSDLRRHGEKIASREPRTPRSERWWRLPGSLRCYYTVYGSAENSTNHCATQSALLEARQLKGRSEAEAAKLKNKRR
jgi:transposase